MSVLFINPLAFIMIPKLDRQNNWKTIVYNPETDEIYKVNKSGYFLLKQLHDANGINREDIVKEQKQFIQQMIQANVVVEKDSHHDK